MSNDNELLAILKKVGNKYNGYAHISEVMSVEDAIQALNRWRDAEVVAELEAIDKHNVPGVVVAAVQSRIQAIKARNGGDV